MATVIEYRPGILASSLALPSPYITTTGGLTGGGASTDADGNSIFFRTFIKAVALEVTQELIDAGLQLELLRYRASYKKRIPATDTYKRIGKHYSHPTNWQPSISITNPSGHDTRGGTTPGVSVDRQTEWLITSRNQVINIFPGSFFKPVVIKYKDTSGGTSFANVLSASYVRSAQVGASNPSSNFQSSGYARKLVPARFAFRYSIIDSNDPRGGRISGPVSNIVVVGYQVHPFVGVDSPFPYPVFDINPKWQPDRLQCWIENKRPGNAFG